MRRLIFTGLVAAVLLATSACDNAGSTALPALSERSVEVSQVTVAATPERIDATGAVVRLTLDTHTVPLDMDLPAAARLSVGGWDWPAQAWTGPGPGGHHREGTLRFSPGGAVNAPIQLVLNGLDEPMELTWTELPR